jgi:hypothetical protein
MNQLRRNWGSTMPELFQYPIKEIVIPLSIICLLFFPWRCIMNNDNVLNDQVDQSYGLINTDKGSDNTHNIYNESSIDNMPVVIVDPTPYPIKTISGDPNAFPMWILPRD